MVEMRRKIRWPKERLTLEVCRNLIDRHGLFDGSPHSLQLPRHFRMFKRNMSFPITLVASHLSAISCVNSAKQNRHITLCRPISQ